jgi:hypothetical protein
MICQVHDGIKAHMSFDTYQHYRTGQQIGHNQLEAPYNMQGGENMVDGIFSIYRMCNFLLLC